MINSIVWTMDMYTQPNDTCENCQWETHELQEFHSETAE